MRVRPAAPVDDFVTAESQHFNSAMNSLVQDEYKYNPIRESKPPITAAEPIATSVTATTTTVTEAIRKSLLQDFLEEMLKNDEVSIPTRVTVGTTELPDWTMTTPMTTPYAEITTLTENHTTSFGHTTLAPNVVAERVTTTGSKEDSREATSSESSDVRKETKSEDYWDKNSQENNTSEQNNLENVEFSENYNLPSHYPDGSGTSKEIEDTIAEMTAIPAVNQEIRKLSAIQKEKEHIMTLRRKQKVNVEENEAHPKNHRAKWSEVRYPSVFDKSKSHSTTSIPGVVARNEGGEDTNVKTLSDYVKAIFDTMKNAEEEEEEDEEEEVAKVVETKNETPAINVDVASLRRTDAEKESEEIDREETDVTEHVRDAHTTERVEETNAVEEARSVTEEATTKESVTRSETTTAQIPDDTTTVAPFEETGTTQDFPATTTTSIKQTTGVKTNSTETTLGKVLRTSTTTKVSHMTEICYRGRCVMTRPKDVMRR